MIQSVARAAKILDILATANREMALVEITNHLGLAKSTVHGLLSTLRKLNLVEQSGFNGKYRLGIRLFELGTIVSNNWDIRTVASPHIQRLLELLGETVHLVVMDNDEVLYVDKREWHHISLRVVTQVGMRLPAHCTGVGKVLLAYMPASEVKGIVEKRGMPHFTKNTVTDLNRLMEDLEVIKLQGYAIDNEELISGVSCVAAPIYDNNGKVIGAISVSGPSGKIKGEKYSEIVEEITGTAMTISRELGYKETLLLKEKGLI
ncbi:MAG: IclR family transcriptional regulator [Desulfitibacter sp. BRH_c19]|nr:MAG: IclR family transcriptional regulator [Desulfitibacter sp. BRH_c19]